MNDIPTPDQVIDWEARFMRLAAAGDIVAHQLCYSDNREILDQWWAARGGYSACSVCNPQEPRMGHE